jgi:DNA (cytosine-5)-methyltransferase 1
VVNCADYGDATSRKRFFLKAVRRGCGRINWPEPTHAENPQADLFGRELKKWRGIGECLDLSDTGRSIFNRKHPLSENTLRRIMVGMRKYNGLDFQMDMLGAGKGDDSRVRPLTAPLPPQHAGGNRSAIVRPFIVRLNKCCDAESVERPISAITAGGQHHVLCQPFIVEHRNNGMAHPIEKPIGTQTTKDHFSIITPLVMGQQSCATARPISEPCPTIATGGAVRGIFPVLEDGRVVDIRIRMLKPSELAAAHSFPKDYVLAGNRSEQVRQIGNSVPVMTAAAMCEADLRGRAA